MTSTTQKIAGILVPDTPLIARAIEYARLHSEPYLFNHSMRSWLFAVSIAEQRKVEHDAEVLAVATLLHDLGLGKDAPPRRTTTSRAISATASCRATSARQRSIC